MMNMDKDEKRNLWLAVILSTLIFLGWGYFFERSERKAIVQSAPVTQGKHSSDASSSHGMAPNSPRLVTLKESLQDKQRIAIETSQMQGSIRLKGGVLDDLVLKNYHVSTDNKSPHVRLLDPQETAHAYFMDVTWGSEDKTIPFPDSETVWTADHGTLTPTTPVTLRAQTSQGLVFEKIISVDTKYLFKITQRIINSTEKDIPFYCQGAIEQWNPPESQGFFILHEGALGYLNRKLIEAPYKDLKKNSLAQESVGGWLGMTDKYWLTALIPDQKKAVKTSFQHVQGLQNTEPFRVSFITEPSTIKSGEHFELTTHFFAGPKILEDLDAYEQVLGVEHFDLAVDFGWFYFLTKPIFYILTWAHQWLGNFGLAIMFLTVLLKMAFFPLANKSYRSMARMKYLQPEVEKIRDRYQSDKLRMNQELMELYKREKVNPMAGCLPMLVQIPVFFALYKVLFISIEMRHAPFYGWIQDLSAPDPTTLFNLFGFFPWTPPAFLMIGAWPLIMGTTMLMQQKLNPSPSDPVQAKVMLLMPVMFTYMLASFPSGLVIYWTWNNILTLLQQWAIMRLDGKRVSSQKKNQSPLKKQVSRIKTRV